MRYARRCGRRCDEVVFEDLDCVEAGRRDRVEFVVQHSRQAHGGNGSSDAALVTKWCRHLRILHRASSRPAVITTISAAQGEVKPFATEWEVPGVS